MTGVRIDCRQEESIHYDYKSWLCVRDSTGCDMTGVRID